MSYKIEEVEGIGPSYAKKLREVDIQTTEDLLRRCGDKKGRVGVSKESGISEKLILEWVNLSDLMRISGVGEEYADLLEEAGVDTVKELATRNADNLIEKIEAINKKKNLVNRVPSVVVVKKWIDQAGKLKSVVSH